MMSSGSSLTARSWWRCYRSRSTPRNIADPQTPAEEVMEEGPTSYRPNKSLDAIHEYMRKNERDDVLITTTNGQLIGILYRQDAERKP
jgi:hypothetical protein